MPEMTDPTGVAAGKHHWFKRFGLTCCKHCGIVRRADGLNKPCRGKVRVELRENRIRSAGQSIQDGDQG